MTEFSKKISDIGIDLSRAIKINPTLEDIGDAEQQKQAEAAAQAALSQVDELAPETPPDINAEIDAVLAHPAAMQSINDAWSVESVTEKAFLEAAKGPDFKFKNRVEEQAYLAALKLALAERLAQEGLKLSGTGTKNLQNDKNWVGIRPALLALAQAATIENPEEIDPNWPESIRAAFEQALNAGVNIPAPLAKQLVKVVDVYNMEGTKALEYNTEGPQMFEEDPISLSGNPELKIQVLTQAIATYLTRSSSLNLSDLQLRNELVALQKKDPLLEMGADGSYREKSVNDLIQPTDTPSLRSQAAGMTDGERNALQEKLAAAEKVAEEAAEKVAEEAVPASGAEPTAAASPQQNPLKEGAATKPLESVKAKTESPKAVPANPTPRQNGIELSSTEGNPLN